MRIWAAITSLAVIACAYLGYRVLSLEARVDALHETLGVPMADTRAVQAAKPASGSDSRLGALERELRNLRDDLQTLEEATGNMPAAMDAPGSEQRILSVVEREQNRLRDRQLEFHHGRWLKLREEALETFAVQHSLSQRQVDQLYELLADEVERMTHVIKKKEMQEEPEKASAELLALLEATDRAAEDVLTEAQIGPWQNARVFERRVLWPWLPYEKSTPK